MQSTWDLKATTKLLETLVRAPSVNPGMDPSSNGEDAAGRVFA